MDPLLLLAGIGFAVYGAHLLVEGGSAIAKRYGIPTLVIGSTIVAFGTSMPEFTVNINSALNGSTDLAFGNILGSNLFNICAIVGIVCLVTPMAIGPDVASKDLPMCLVGAAAVGICGNQLYFDEIKYHELFLSDGLIFLMFFAIFMRYVYAEAASSDAHASEAARRGVASPASGGGSGSAGGGAEGDELHSMAKSVAYVIIGLLGLVFGGEFIVDGASGIARSLGLSERIIGLVIVGPGTSFPELIASVTAARRGDVGMVLGNVLGSNIFNIFFTLGVTAMILPIPLDLALNTALLVNLGVTALLVAFAIFAKNFKLGRVMGLLLLTVYVGYLTSAVISGG